MITKYNANSISKVKDAYNEENIFRSYIDKGLIKAEENIFSQYLSWEDEVLDVGCYVGRVSFEIAVRSVIGIDIAEKAIKTAKKIGDEIKATNCDFIVASATHLPLRNYLFDKVLIPYNGIETVPKKENRIHVIEECYRVLKQNGLLIFSISNRLYIPLLFNILKANIVRFMGKLSKRATVSLIKKIKNLKIDIDIESVINSEMYSVIAIPPNSKIAFPMHFYTKREIVNELKNIGFEFVKVYPVGNQNPYSENGRKAEIIEEKIFFNVPNYFIIAKKPEVNQ